MKRRNHRNRWKYKNITIVILGVMLAIVLSRLTVFHQFLLNLGGFGYMGAFIAGILFVSTFTVATSALVLLTLAQTLSPIEIGLIAGLGAVVGDIVIFHVVRDNLSLEITSIYNSLDRKKHVKKLFHSRYFNWMLPIIGALIIASPFPDEMGISLMGISKISTLRFIILSYFLNSLGLFLIVSTAIVIKP